MRKKKFKISVQRRARYKAALKSSFLPKLKQFGKLKGSLS